MYFKRLLQFCNTEISVIRALVQPGIAQFVCDLEFLEGLQFPGTHELSFPAIAFNVKLLHCKTVLESCSNFLC